MLSGVSVLTEVATGGHTFLTFEGSLLSSIYGFSLWLVDRSISVCVRSYHGGCGLMVILSALEPVLVRSMDHGE